MKRKNILMYAAILIAITIGGTFLAAGLKYVSVKYVAKVSTDQTGRSETEEIPESEVETVSNKEVVFQMYRDYFSPKVIGMKKENEGFLNEDRKEQFLQSMADTLFIKYGEPVKVSEIVIGERQEDMNGEITYLVQVKLEQGTEEYLAAYNQNYDVYILTAKEKE